LGAGAGCACGGIVEAQGGHEAGVLRSFTSSAPRAIVGPDFLKLPGALIVELVGGLQPGRHSVTSGPKAEFSMAPIRRG
jgi:hypothetical protein